MFAFYLGIDIGGLWELEVVANPGEGAARRQRGECIDRAVLVYLGGCGQILETTVPMSHE